MDAIVLVGGQGTRLRPLTARRHKSLVPLLNKPAIGYLFEWLRDSGVKNVVLAIGQHNEDLATAYPEGCDPGFRLRHVMERERLESGGAIRFAVNETGIDDRFLVLNGDVYLDFDLREAERQHEALGADLTLALTRVDDPSSFGVAVLDDRSMITGFVEKPPAGTAPSNLINAGAWIFERRIVDEIPPGAVRVEETLFPSLVERHRPVFGYVMDGLWADIGTPKRYLDLSRALIAARGQCLAANSQIHPAATVRGSSIGAGSTIAAGAVVEDSVLWETVTVGEGARVERSVVADGASIAPNAVLLDVVVGPGASISAGTTLTRGGVVEADVAV